MAKFQVKVVTKVATTVAREKMIQVNAGEPKWSRAAGSWASQLSHPRLAMAQPPRCTARVRRVKCRWLVQGYGRSSSQHGQGIVEGRPRHHSTAVQDGAAKVLSAACRYLQSSLAARCALCLK